MTAFRILHLSDLHFGSQPNQVNRYEARFSAPEAGRTLFRLTSHDLDCAEFAARVAFEELSTQAIDTVIVSGDLARSGADDDLAAAFDFVNSESRSGWLRAPSRPTLRGHLGHVKVLPGNHDRFGLIGRPGDRKFDSVFRNYWNAGQGAQHLQTLSSAAASDELIVLGLDCTLREMSEASSALHYIGQGRAHEDVLESLKLAHAEATKGHGTAACILVVHFSPFHPRGQHALRLIDEQRLLDCVAELGIEHVLAGHYHDAAVYKLHNDTITVHSAGSACHCASHENSFHIRSFEVSSSRVTAVSRTDFRWDRQVGDWLVEGPFPE